jgi:hypothetical protein
MEEKAQGDNIPQSTTSVQNVSVDLPTAFDYEGSSFYVRECYATYYDSIIELLKRYKYISVTGTPGLFVFLCISIRIDE